MKLTLRPRVILAGMAAGAVVAAGALSVADAQAAPQFTLPDGTCVELVGDPASLFVPCPDPAFPAPPPVVSTGPGPSGSAGDGAALLEPVPAPEFVPWTPPAPEDDEEEEPSSEEAPGDADEPSEGDSDENGADSGEEAGAGEAA